MPSSSRKRSEIEAELSAQRRDRARRHSNAPKRRTADDAPSRDKRILGGDLNGVRSRSWSNQIFSKISEFGIVNTVAAFTVGAILLAFFWPGSSESVKEVKATETEVEPKAFYTESRADIPEVNEGIDSSNSSFSRESDVERAEAFREQDFLERRSNELLEKAETQLSENRFIRPPGNNAVETYRSVLKLNPNNVDAKQGLEYIVGRFLSTGSAAVLRNDLDEARTALATINQIDASSSAAIELGELISGAEKTERISTALANAQAAVKRDALILPARNNALYFYREVLSLDGENAEAQAGIKQISDEYVRLANAAALAGEYEAASGYLATVSVIDPNSDSIELIETIISRAKPIAKQVKPHEQPADNSTSEDTKDVTSTDSPDVEPVAVISEPSQQSSNEPAVEQAISQSKTPDQEAAEQAAFDRQYLDRGLEAYYSGDYQTAAALLKPLADKGISRAQFRIAYMHYLGRGYSQNRSEADRIIRAALPAIQKFAAEGRAWAQSDLGSLYEDGLVLPKNYKEAFFWYRAAAEQGYPGAQTNLGILYARGLGVSTDRRAAVDWFKKAAAQGDAAAQRNLEAMGESS